MRMTQICTLVTLGFLAMILLLEVVCGKQVEVSSKGGSLLYVHGSHLVWTSTRITLRDLQNVRADVDCPIVAHSCMPKEFVACRMPALPPSARFNVVAFSTDTLRELSIDHQIEVIVRAAEDGGMVTFAGSRRRRLSGVAGDTLHLAFDSTVDMKRVKVMVGGHAATVNRDLTGLHAVSLPIALVAGQHKVEVIHDSLNADDHLVKGPRGLLELRDDTVFVHPTIRYIDRFDVEGEDTLQEVVVYGTGFAPGVDFQSKHVLKIPHVYESCDIIHVDYHALRARCRLLSVDADYGYKDMHQPIDEEVKHIGLSMQIYDLSSQPQFEDGKSCANELVLGQSASSSNCPFSTFSPMQFVHLQDKVSFPELHPTKDNRPRDIKSYLLMTVPHKNSFRAPWDGEFSFSIECGPNHATKSRDNCALRVDNRIVSPETRFQFSAGQVVPVEFVFLHMSDEDSRVSDSIFTVGVTVRDARTGVQTFKPVPAEWFEHEMVIHTHQVQLIVNQIDAICRSPSKVACSLEAPIQFRPHHVSYPSHVISASRQLDEESSITSNLPMNAHDRSLQTTVQWSNYAATCGRTCIIPAGTRVILNTDMDVDSLVIRGELVWDTTKSGLTLATGFSCVENDGVFTLGTDASPMTLPATIYLRNNGQAHPAIGKRAFGSFIGTGQTGPRLEIVGRVLARTWTLLTSNVEIGGTVIQVAHSNMGWLVGDRIAIAPTILPVTSATGAGYSETFTVAAISGTTITLSGAVTQKYLGLTARRFQAEVINLSRNVRITGDDFDSNGHGLHVIQSGGGVMRISYARIEKGGQRGVLGRYPLHFHLMRSCPQCLFKGNAIEDSQQRGIIVHGTHDANVEDNVLYLIRGAGLYVEDGNEMQNTFTNNVNICQDGSRERMACRASGTDNEQGDFVQQSGIWALSVTNNFIGNRLINHYNAIFTQTSAFPNARGFAAGKVCTVNAPFGNFSGNVCHSNWRFGFYLDNSMPRQLARSVASNGFVTDIANCDGASSSSCSCQEFKADGSDNGKVGIVADQFDWFSDFVGCYELGDLQLLRFKSHNNLKNWYWKHTKNFQDGVSSHVKDSEFGFYSDLNIPGMPAEGVAHLMGPGGLGAFIIENTKFFGGVGEGAVAMNQHCGVGPGTGALCTPEYTFVNVDFSGMARTSRWIKFGVSDGNPELPIATTVDPDAGSLGGFRSVASGFQTHLLSAPGGVCRLASEVGRSVEFDNGIVCAQQKLRRLQVWSGNQGTLTLQGPGGGTYGMKYQSSPCDLCPQPVATKTGYGAVVIAGASYSLPALNWSFKPSPSSAFVTIEFSDIIFGTRFGASETLQLSVNGQACAGGVSSQHSRLWIGLDGPKQPNVGACRTTGPAPPPQTKSPTVATTKSPTGPTLSPQSASQRVLIWQDEFDGTTLNLTKWERMVLPAFAFNNERQAYTNRVDNSFVSGGFLTVRAKQESFNGASYTSARLRTAFKGDWIYGRVEVRAKVPTGQGLWPAIWMLPTDDEYGSWPKSGEIDIMEHVTCDLNNVHATVHTEAYNHIKGTQIGTTIATNVAAFHVYAMEWTPSRIRVFLDDLLFFEFENDNAGNSATWPYNKRFHLLLNIAVGGDWGGFCLNGAAPQLGGNQDMVIDYVRVYAPQACSALGIDPYVSGGFITCCPSLVQCLRDWNNNGNLFYRCTSSQQTCDNGSISPPPTTLSPTVATTKSPTVVPPACTNVGADPFASGSLNACCAGLVQCLRDWNNNGNSFYKCTTSQQTCDNGSISPPPTTRSPTATTPTCSAVGVDPYASGSLVACCSGLVQCLRDWNSNNNFFYRCTTSQQTCDSGSISPPPSTKAPTKTPTTIATKAPTIVTKSPTGAQACTASSLDPYSTGSLVACCAGLQQCLATWNGDGRLFYKCFAQCPTGAPTGTPRPTVAPAATCTPLDGNPASTGLSCCSGLVSCFQAWESPSIVYPRCRSSCPVTSAPSPALIDCERYSCGYDCSLRAAEGCGWSSSVQFPKFSGPGGSGTCVGGSVAVTTQDELDDGVCSRTASPVGPRGSSAPTAAALPCTPPLTPCTTISAKLSGPCFVRGAGNLATGIGFSFADIEGCRSGAVGCVSDTGCRNCRLLNANPEEWDFLPVCPACLCILQGVDAGLCRRESCSPTSTPTAQPGLEVTTANSNNSTPMSTMGGAIGGGLAVLFLAAGAAVYVIRRKDRDQSKSSTVRMSIASPQSGDGFGSQMAALNPIFSMEQRAHGNYGGRAIDV